MLSVQTNMAALNANRQLGMTTKANTKRSEKLSSGYRINRAADDAAGLSISEKMRRQIRGLTQATANAQDGISMVQIGEGALNEVHDMLHRANELAIKAATGTLQDMDRAMIDEEIQQLKAEIDSTGRNTSFNDILLFPENGWAPANAGYVETKSYDIFYDPRDGSMVVNAAQAGPGVSGTGRAASAVQVSSGSKLADMIANDIVPNAVKQILDTFTPLKTAVGNDTIKMSLDVAYIDGKNQTLAYASFRYGSSGKPVSMGIRVDSADFKEADVNGTGDRVEVLKSTLTHELMHSVMQYTLTDGMSGRRGGKYPTWFVEGTAQLAGGGFSIGWNDALTAYAHQLTSENDASQDGNIASYLKRYTMAGRPYGHGYLGTAYFGYLAGGGETSGKSLKDTVTDGMNLIFEDLLKGQTLDSVLKNRAGITTADMNQRFKTGEAKLTEFVRRLAYESNHPKSGAGSFVAASLDAGGSSLLASGWDPSQPFQIDPDRIRVDYGGAAVVGLQVGVEPGTHIDVNLYQMNAKALGLEDTNVRTMEDADLAIEGIKRSIQYVSNVRSYYGAVQNRLEHTINNLNNITENTTEAESRIRDTDVAELMVRHSNNQILMQAGTSMLTQANQQSQMILSLLG